MAYVTQLLPDLEEARLLRTLLSRFVREELGTEEELDMAYKLLSKLSDDIRKATKK